MNRRFSKEDKPTVNKHMKRCLTSLIARETQIKIIVRYHLISIRMAANKNNNSNKTKHTQTQNQKVSVVEDVEKLKRLCTLGWNIKWCGHCGKYYEGFSKFKNRTTISSSNPTSGYISKRN